ncbi:hypothetical protein BH23ACT11_BH23ACT11_09190 [soil metagenome]
MQILKHTVSLGALPRGQWKVQASKVRDEWHTDAQESTTIEEVPQHEVELPAELQETYEGCLPYYEELRKHRLDPANVSEVPKP